VDGFLAAQVAIAEACGTEADRPGAVRAFLMITARHGFVGQRVYEEFARWQSKRIAGSANPCSKHWKQVTRKLKQSESGPQLPLPDVYGNYCRKKRVARERAKSEEADKRSAAVREGIRNKAEEKEAQYRARARQEYDVVIQQQEKKRQAEKLQLNELWTADLKRNVSSRTAARHRVANKAMIPFRKDSVDEIEDGSAESDDDGSASSTPSVEEANRGEKDFGTFASGWDTLRGEIKWKSRARVQRPRLLNHTWSRNPSTQKLPALPGRTLPREGGMPLNDHSSCVFFQRGGVEDFPERR